MVSMPGGVGPDVPRPTLPAMSGGAVCIQLRKHAVFCSFCLGFRAPVSDMKWESRHLNDYSSNL